MPQSALPLLWGRLSPSLSRAPVGRTQKKQHTKNTDAPPTNAIIVIAFRQPGPVPETQVSTQGDGGIEGGGDDGGGGEDAGGEGGGRVGGVGGVGGGSIGGGGEGGRGETVRAPQALQIE